MAYQLLLPAFPLEELSAAEASSQTQKTFVLTLSELFQEILYAYDTKPIGWFLLIKSDMYRILALLAQYQLFLHPEPLCTRKKKDLISVKNSYVIFRITMILKSVFQILLLYSI